MQVVGIIGGSGFIGSYITKVFLEENFYAKVSVTDCKNFKKYNHLFSLDNAVHLRIEEVDVCRQEQLATFVKDCDILVHAGSPHRMESADNQQDLCISTLQGTRNILKEVKNCDRPGKLIFVSSIAAWNTSFPLTPAAYAANHLFCERDIPHQCNGVQSQVVQAFCRP